MTGSDAIALSPREKAIVLAVLSKYAADIRCAAIFGSRALGTARPASDIDLVLYGTLDDRAISRIWSLFDQSSLAVTVDVVRYEGLSDGSFRRHIDACAKPLFSRDELISARTSAQAA